MNMFYGMFPVASLRQIGQFLRGFIGLCQVGLSADSWKLLERHLHRYAFQNSGHKLPNNKFATVGPTSTLSKVKIIPLKFHFEHFN